MSFVEQTILSPLNSLGPLVENQLAIDVRAYFWMLNSLLFIYPKPHCLDYCGSVFAISFKSCLEFSDSILLSKLLVWIIHATRPQSCSFRRILAKTDAQGSFSLNETGVGNNLSAFKSVVP